MLEGQNVSYHLGLEPLIKFLSFSLDKGEMMAVKGPNGSGKSTLLRLISGLLRPSSGSLLWNGKKITLPTPFLYIGHKLGLHPEGCVKDQLKIWQSLYGANPRALEEALQVWGLGSFREKKIWHLSQGLQKRLSLSRCSLLSRPLWILDEPHASLDLEGQDLLAQHMDHHLKKGGIIVLATHEDISCHKEVCL